MANSQEPTWPGQSLVQITPNNSTDLTDNVRQIYCGVGGDITVVTSGNTVVLFKNVLTGSVIGPFFVKRVNVTGTTATNLVGFV